MELPDPSPDLKDARTVDPAIGEEGGDRSLGPAQPTAAITTRHPQREMLAERLVAPVGFAAVAHAPSIDLTQRIFKRSLDKRGRKQSIFNGSLELIGGVVVSARKTGARDVESA